LISPFTARSCPYCGHGFMLGACPIVATNTEISYYGTDLDDAIPRPVSGAKVLGVVGDPSSQECWPIVAKPLLDLRRSHGAGDLARLARRAITLPPAQQSADPQDLPARACLNCEHPLPSDIDDRRIITIAVLGTKSSGKTHYLASAMYLACRMQGLNRAGCVQFEADDLTAKHYHEKYFEPVFVNRHQIGGTSVDDQVRFSPLVYRVRFTGAEPCSLLLHDISGEMLDDPKMRARYAEFIYRADGAIFLVDPEQMSLSNGHRMSQESIGARTYNQADLLISWLGSLTRQIPVAVALSKSDLVSGAVPGWFGPQDEDADRLRHDWPQHLATVGQHVEEVFARFQAYDLLAAVRRNRENMTLHAVAALGAAPRADGTVDTIAPRGCLDPLMSLLARIPGVVGQPPQ
jgi:hypothetical protein